MLKLAAFLLAAICFGGPAAGATAVVKTDQVRAELMVHAPNGVASGQPLWLGLRIEHQPQWHTYWKNPGDSGLPTHLKWTLPAGFSAGEIAWPTPKPLRVGPLMNYGYEGTLLLAVPLTVPSGFSAAVLPVRLAAQWLVCKDVCIPESGEFAIEVPARAASVSHAAAFEAARAALPSASTQASGSARVAGQSLELRLQGLPQAWAGQALHLFPELAGVIDNAAPPRTSWSGDAWTAAIALSPQRDQAPASMAMVVARSGASEAGVRLQVPISGAWPAVLPAGAAAQDLAGEAQAAPMLPSPDALSWASALLFALVGGALLNLMPCVFPVLSLKLVALASHAGDRGRSATAAAAYSVGVVLSFVALAAMLAVLRAAGEQIGWGFQLQSPGFVAALALLFTLIGLNLAGVFEFGTWLPGSLAGVRLRHPLADNFLSGVLAVAVASPCTAPFMGASLGAAASLPTAQSLAVFAALGLGMSAPYLAVSLWPALARALPRPGAWMLRFKALMAFPMFATVVWLLWVLGRQLGVDAVTALLGVLVALSFAAWAWAGAGGSGRARHGAAAAAAAVLAATLVWAWPSLWGAGDSDGNDPRSDSGSTRVHAQRDASARIPGEPLWRVWSPQAVKDALAQGRPVFVDFTAAWCVTCQFNKRTVLADEGVLADFAARRVVLMRADWTRRDADITQALRELGRSGVPVYLLLAPSSAPRLLSELPSVQEIRQALSTLP